MNTIALSVPQRVARLTATQVHAMLDAGILREGEPLELIDGLLLYKDRSASGGDPMTIGEKHNLVIKLLARLDPDLEPHGAHLQTQGPVRLSDASEPEPDGAVLKGDPRAYGERIPSERDVASVIEVADSSLEYDRTTKARLYADAGIAQYLIINVRDGEIEVHEGPSAGGYTRSRVIHRGQDLQLRRSESAALTVAAARLLP